jgi:hypothetical protein
MKTHEIRIEDVSTRSITPVIETLEFGDQEDHRVVLQIHHGDLRAYFFKQGLRDEVGRLQSEYMWRKNEAVTQGESVKDQTRFSIKTEKYGDKELDWEGHATLVICIAIPEIAEGVKGIYVSSK